MSILLLYKYVQIGGVATYLKTLSSLCSKHGYTVYLATTVDEENKATRDILEQAGVQIIPIKYSSNRPVLVFRFLKKILKEHTEFHFDIIHSHHRLTHLIGKLLSIFKAIPLLLTIHEFKDDQKLTTRFWKNEHITVPSRALKHHLINEYEIKADCIHVIPNVIEQKYRVDRSKIDILKKRFFDDETAIYVIYIGRIAHEKGVDIIVESMPMVKKRNSSIQFRIVGSGPMLPRLKQRCNEIGINPEKIFIGKHYDINELLFLSDIAVSPSRKESFSIFALEAMRASIPLIASRVGGLPEVVTDGESGMLIRPDSPQELAEAILELSKVETKRKQLGLNARAEFTDKFSALKFIRDYQKIYRQLTSRNG